MEEIKERNGIKNFMNNKREIAKTIRIGHFNEIAMIDKELNLHNTFK